MVVNFPDVIEGYISPFPWWNIPIIRDGGADYMERNALALVKLISNLNTRLQNIGSQEKIVIVGPSMGGLISRYALSYMEKNGPGHNCRLWVSFDAPHLGANISIGAQYWLEYYSRVAKNKGAGDVLKNKIGSVAAQQLLLDHYIGHSVPGSPLTATSAPFRQQFLQNQQNNSITGNNGFPQNLRKVSLTNGSGSGVVQPAGTACSQVLNMKGYSRNWIHFFGLAGNLVRKQATESNIYFTSDYGATCKVFDGWYSKFIFNNKQTEEKYAQTPPNTRSYDIVPGGYYNTIEAIKKEGTISDAVSFTTFSNVVNNHAFIPTVSALALTNGNTRNWAENLSNRNLVCTGETPFNAYFSPTNNEDHVSLTSSSADWVKSELNNLPVPSPYTIEKTSGNEPICESTATFQAMNLPTGATVTWSTNSSSISIQPTLGPQTTVARISNGGATLIATINTCAGTSISTREVRVGGYSSSDYPVTGPYSACTNESVYFNTNPLPGATNYQWFWPGDWTYESGQGTPYLALRTGYSSGGGSVGVRVANQCDAGGSPAYWYVQVNDCGYYYSISPNPATSTVTASSKETTTKGERINKTITEVNIYDQQGNLKKHQKFGKVNNATLNIADLRTGIYFIEIVDGVYKERQQLSVLH